MPTSHLRADACPEHILRCGRGVPFSVAWAPPLGYNVRSRPFSMNLVQSQHALLACFSAGSCRRWRRCARLSLEANKLRFYDPVQPGDVAARSQAAPRQSPRNHVRRSWTRLILNKVAMWFWESCLPDQISNASLAQGAGSGGAGSDCRQEHSLQLQKLKKRGHPEG